MDSITLELGDFIEILAPANRDLHEQTFYILYLDDAKINITNVSTFLVTTLKHSESGHLNDESIESIHLLSRSPERGYARQHLLLPKTWIDIHFGGDVPSSVTGEITNLEEDMIEITAFPEKDVFYIDFAYKGIPETLPIEQINIRAKPASLEKIASLVNVSSEEFPEGEGPTAEPTSSMEYTDEGHTIIRHSPDVEPDDNIGERLHPYFVAANTIVFEEALDEIQQKVEIPEYHKRFSIDIQTNNLMDELLSEIPTQRRSKDVLDDIHRLIERYRELRQEFSIFDTENGNIVRYWRVEPEDKPLAETLHQLSAVTHWILPVTSLVRTLYLDNPDTVDADVAAENLGTILAEEEAAQKAYKDNARKGATPIYLDYYSKMAAFLSPVSAPNALTQFLAPNKSVAEDMESVVDNFGAFQSTVAEKGTPARKKFVLQRYTTSGVTYLADQSGKDGRRIFIREPIIPDDKMTIGSYLVLPPAVRKKTAMFLPKTSILDRMGLAANPVALFRLLSDAKIRPLTGAMEMGSSASTIQHVTMDPDLLHETARWERFLDAMVPATADIIENTLKSYIPKFSVQDIVDVLDSYSIEMKNVAYSHFKKIRFWIKENRKIFLSNMEDNRKRLDVWRSARPPFQVSPSEADPVSHMLVAVPAIFQEIYGFSQGEGEAKPGSGVQTLSKILATDSGRILAFLLQLSVISLTTPERLSFQSSKASEDEDEEMSIGEKIKARDCVRRVLTKRYETLGKLQKDNAEDDVFYDAEFDDTPYAILEKYREEQKKYSPEDFVDYFAEALVGKHDCPAKIAKEMARDIIAGKKRVREGEYAVLENAPQSKEGVRERDDDVEREIRIRKRFQYYRRTAHKTWVHDDTLDEHAFIDSNTLFCNLTDKTCVEDDTTPMGGVCESMEDAQKRMREIAHKKIRKEFDERYDESVSSLKDFLENRLKSGMREVVAEKALSRLESRRANNVAYELGRYLSDKGLSVAESPHLPLCNLILGQPDFVKRQQDILEFVGIYCREPMVQELGENPWFLYCKDSNRPLFPTFIRDLAQAFVEDPAIYQEKLAEICRRQGDPSADGGNWVDKHSGREICKFDFAEEELYDDTTGFRILTTAAMSSASLEKDVITQVIGDAKKEARVFDNETTQTIYNIFFSIAQNISLPTETIEEFVLRASNEIIATNVQTKKKYEEKAAKREKDTGKREPPYAVYYEQFAVFVVACVILVAVQTAVPPFKIRKTFPGCVQSFQGYPSPFDRETMRGFNYITCVLNKTKAGWESMKHMGLVVIEKNLRKVMDEVVIKKRPDFADLYEKRAKYVEEHPEDADIPEEYAVRKWTGFLPPVVAFSVVRRLEPIADGYRKELLEMMKTGNRMQRQQIAMFKTRAVQYGYGIIELISQIVAKKDVLLQTAAAIPYIENACCNDGAANMTTLEYFEKESAEIGGFLSAVGGWEEVLASVRAISRASMLYSAGDTRLRMGAEQTQRMEHFEENAYLALVHYCNMDRDTPFPQDLHGILSEKMVGYDPRATVQEKVAFFKSHGRSMTVRELEMLMDVVRRRNIIPIQVGAVGGKGAGYTDGLLDFIAGHERETFLDPRVSDILAKALKTPVAKSENMMVLEDSEEVRELKNVLSEEIGGMQTSIEGFLRGVRKIPKKERDIWLAFLVDAPKWKDQDVDFSLKTATQFMQNSIFAITHVYPEIIVTGHFPEKKIPDHWKLGGNHVSQLAGDIEKHYKVLEGAIGSETLASFLRNFQEKSRDISLFLSFIPVQYEIAKRGGDGKSATFHGIFDKRAVTLLYTYCWMRCFVIYLECAKDESLLELVVQGKMANRRAQIREAGDPSLIESVAEDSVEETGLEEVEVVYGNVDDIKEGVADLMVGFLKITRASKDVVDFSKADVEKQVVKSKQAEKKMITDFLQDMSSEERQVENLKKIMKLGRWSVGLQKGIVSYDKDTWEREQKELLLEQYGGGSDELEQDVEDTANEADDIEGEEISGLGYDYGNSGEDGDGNGGYTDEDGGEEE